MEHRKSVMPPPREPRTPQVGFNLPPQTYRSGYRTQMEPRPSTTNARMSIATEARYSMAAGSLSMGGRQSTIPGVHGKKVTPIPKLISIKDERNLRDKTVQSRIIEKIVRFLEDREPAPSFRFDERSFLRNPSKNDFSNVFEFLFQCMEPNFKVTKIEEEALRLMNQLGYPYALKHSTMQTMTVPTTWPTLLGVLDWLVDIVEIENQLYQETKVKDQAQWQLLTSCYKRYAGCAVSNANMRQGQEVSFSHEFEEYKRVRMTENGVDEEAFDHLRAKRVAQEQAIKEVQAKIIEKQRNIHEVEKTITDVNADIAAVNDYLEQMNIKIANTEEMLNEAQMVIKEQTEKLSILAKENQEKEQRIAKQEISGEKARALVARRYAIREELGTMRDQLNETEAKLFELQPIFYKQSSKVRSDYNNLLSGLRGLCQSLFNSAELEQLSINLSQYDFDKFKSESGDENKLSKLMSQLKTMAEQKLLTSRNTDTKSACEKVRDEIRELEVEKEQQETKQKLELERARRSNEDKMRPLLDAKYDYDIAKQKHEASKAEFDKVHQQLDGLHSELADISKKYMDYKNKLDAQYSEIQAHVLEKMTKLCERFQKIQEQKKRYEELGKEIIAANNKELMKLGKESGKGE